MKLGWLATIGFLLSGFYLLVIFVLTRDDLTNLSKLPVNELGDFLTGVFGPIAVFWLVLGYLQQGNELKLSVKALELQADELRNSVEQQSKLAELSREQLSQEFDRQREEKAHREAMDRGAFVVKFEGSYGRVDGDTEHHISVVNLGQSVASFGFMFGNGLQLVESEIFDEDGIEITYPIWERHKGRRYTFIVGGVIDENCTSLNLEYTNYDGTVVERNFLVTVDQDAHFESLILREIV